MFSGFFARTIKTSGRRTTRCFVFSNFLSCWPFRVSRACNRHCWQPTIRTGNFAESPMASYGKMPIAGNSILWGLNRILQCVHNLIILHDQSAFPSVKKNQQFNFLFFRCLDQVPVPSFHHLRPEELSRNQTMRESLVHRQSTKSQTERVHQKQTAGGFEARMFGAVFGRKRICMQVSFLWLRTSIQLRRFHVMSIRKHYTILITRLLKRHIT